MRRSKFARLQDGFSLVEVAIVLAIVGIMIAGVMKGRDLLENARLKSVISQINEFRIATYTFYDRYHALPGDYEQASINIHRDLINGNGNGVIENGDESISFWRHLAAARLIALEISNTSPNPVFGEHLPACRLGGGFTVVSDPEESMPGVWFILSQKRDNHYKAALLTPQQAFNIMSNNDHKDPYSGKIQARAGEGTEVENCIKDHKLNLEYQKPACILYFQL